MTSLDINTEVEAQFVSKRFEGELGFHIMRECIPDLRPCKRKTLPTGADYLTSTTGILKKLGWANLKERSNKQKAVMMFKIVNGMTTRHVKDIFSARPGDREPNRQNITYTIPRARTYNYNHPRRSILKTILQRSK